MFHYQMHQNLVYFELSRNKLNGNVPRTMEKVVQDQL